MEERTYKVFKFHELTEKQKEKVLDRYYTINVDFDWWYSVYDDAAEIGLQITSFDLGRAQECTGKFLINWPDVIENILKEHGDSCETYKTAKRYKEKAAHGLPVEDVNKETLDDTLREFEEAFLHGLLEDYRMILKEEYEYLTSKAGIIETLEANDYDFTEDGKID